MSMIQTELRGTVVVMTLNRPPVNAIDDAMIAAFNAELDRLELRTDWQVLHLRSSQKVFAAGADLDLIRSWKDAPSPAAALGAYIERLQALYRRIEGLAQVTVAELGGAAMGGGLELALSCDLRIAAEEAKLGLPEVGIGLLPGAGGTQRLTRLAGRGVAKRVILLAEPVDGRTAAQLGIVEWTFPRERLADETRALIERMAALPAHAQRASKQCIQAAEADLQQGYRLEKELGGALLDSTRTQQLIGAFLDRNARR